MNRRQFGTNLGSAVAMTLGRQVQAATKGTSEERRLVVMPLLGSREVFIVPPARPHCFVRHLSLEGFACRNVQDVLPSQGEAGMWGSDHIWEWREDGTFGCKGTVAEGVTYALDMRPTDEMIDMHLLVSNQSNKTFQELYAHMCLDIRRNTFMYDPTLERTYVQVGTQCLPMHNTDVAKSLNGVMPVYFLKGTPPEKRWIPKGLRAYGWDISSTETDAPLVAITSRDGAWTTGEWFWPCQYVIGNYKKPYHGCIHSEPAFGTVEPGQSAAVRGRLYITKGKLEKVWARMTADWNQVRNLKVTAAA